MTKHFLSALLLFATPALATITQVQSNATWGTPNTTTCTVGLTNTTHPNLLVVWATWSPSSLTASVNDQPNTNSFPSAVGPTVQSASNTAAQIFYSKSIHGTTSDNIQINFSGGTASTASCVAVEYSGADQNYPLDSVSAGYGYSAGSYMDSGTAAPANANLLVFGGGVNSNNTLPSPGSGFTSVQSNGGTGSVTEQMIVSGNNTLQRATAALSGAGTGNWVMQMAVFRDASWTVAGGWTPTRLRNIVYADQFPGSDIGAQINNAAAACQNPRGCTIHVPTGFYPYQTQIMLSSGPHGTYPITLECEAGGDSTGGTYGTTTLYFTPTTGVAVTFNVGPPGGGINGCTIFGSGSGNSGTTGLYVEGAVGSIFSNIQIGDLCGFSQTGCSKGFGFGTGLQINTAALNVYLTDFYKMYLRGNGKNLNFPYTGDNTTNENINFFGGVLSGGDNQTPVQTCATLSNFEMQVTPQWTCASRLPSVM
jgi:hypothetical protein